MPSPPPKPWASATPSLLVIFWATSDLGVIGGRKLNKLLESKCPDEAGRVNDPEYCKYHQVVSHPIERCFVVKEKIIALAKEGKIIFDIKEAAGTNVANITATNNRYVLEGNQEVKQPPTTTSSTLQFGSFEPIQIEALFVEEEKKILTEDDDGWILVTHRQRQRRHVNKLHPSLPRKPRFHKYPHHANAKNKIEKMSHQRLPTKTYCLDPNRITDRSSFWGLYKSKRDPMSHWHDSTRSYRGRTKPFTEEESYFADVKLYLDPDNKQNQPKDHSPLHFKGRKQLKEARVKDLREIKTELVTPITSLHPLISSDSPILKDQHRNVQGVFSQKTYHLLAKSGYNFSAPSRLNKLNPKLIGEKIHELTKAQHKLRKQDFRVDQPCIGLDGVQNAPLQLEDGIQATIDELKELNLDRTEEPHPIFISALLSLEEEQYFKTLGEYKDVFAWTKKEMPGLDPKVSIHHLGIKYGAHPVKQSQRVLRPDLIPCIEMEVNKFIEAGFIREVKYPTWISNVMPINKKNGQIHICIDF
ncbi:UNVERIFIED_CONTAM: hypothetical protein Scaly_0599000 [Sesamum calycinum]|uniref:Uncharacterized protein n=1 Tax=Sesamum calycinum TaxID=2727403 RepID=A0AAW2RSE2_9LAMI